MSEMVIPPHCIPALVCLVVLPLGHSQAGTLRIVTWNVADRPNMPEQVDAFRSVFAAMDRPDILALQEANSATVRILVDLMNEAYNPAAYKSVTSEADSGGDRTAAIYNAGRLVPGTQLIGGITHNTVGIRFDFVGASNFPGFSVVPVRLKSGDDSTEIAMRETEARTLRRTMQSFAQQTGVVVAGDFNTLGPEPAWNVFLAPGIGQVFDPAGAIDLTEPIDAWRDDAALVALHTQDPSDKMDDRFDLIVGTTDLADGVGYELVAESYRVFGNNGSHELDKPITSGTGAAPEVLDALTVASDHLPVMIDLRLPELEPGDRDQDGDFDQLDMVGVQIAVKYLTGRSATWGEGDWNGGPGGSPGDPPVGDGLFNQLDLVAALRRGHYLAGPYAGLQPRIATVPEPGSLLLLVIGLASVAFARGGMLDVAAATGLTCCGEPADDSQSLR